MSHTVEPGHNNNRISSPVWISWNTPGYFGASHQQGNLSMKNWKYARGEQIQSPDIPKDFAVI